ncbi:MAG: 30S ribosomal protein S16 [Holophagales bacterium]|jgi:small subunit ribosomal protein S16|nr:30S ribosomal protein S16 [Holophagales bacterium]MBK9372856.1 30S ribosomal protein S16 [Holophagales bacterium]
MLKIRLRRTGGSNAPAYRIVVSDSRSTPTAKVLEELGYYDPTKNPPLLDLNVEKAKAWIAKGASASETVQKLMARPKA